MVAADVLVVACMPSTINREFFGREIFGLQIFELKIFHFLQPLQNLIAFNLMHIYVVTFYYCKMCA